MSFLKIAALITAAGKSHRMGAEKALMPLLGMPAIFFQLEQLRSLTLKKVLVTLPPRLYFNKDLHQRLTWSQCHILMNLYDELGYAGSLKTALETTMRPLDGMLICPVDAPLTSPQLLQAMASFASSRRGKACIIVPHYRATPGHPVYVSNHFFAALTTCHTMGGLRGFIEHYRCSMQALFWPDANLSLNLNSPSDLASLRG